MGQCYDIKASFKFDDAFLFKTKYIDSLLSKECNWNCTKADMENKGLADLMNLLFIDVNGLDIKVLKNDSIVLTFYASFEQSYNWEILMMDVFEEITPVLRNGSSLVICPDNDYDKLVVKNNMCIYVH